MEDIVKNFYDDIIKSPNFNGNYFEAMLNAVAMAKCYSFLKSTLERSSDERQNY